jgi:hypothetical protein
MMALLSAGGCACAREVATERSERGVLSLEMAMEMVMSCRLMALLGVLNVVPG